MIDPYKITDFNRTEPELQEFWFFCLCVAGKTAKVIARSLDNFLFNSEYSGATPFETVRDMNENGALIQEMKRARLGKYQLLSKGFVDSLRLDLRKASVKDLEKVAGCGPKTARFFILHSRSDQKNIAVLDTHILNYLREKGHPIKKGHPSLKDYLEYEKIFLKEAGHQKMSAADFDLMIWSSKAR